MTRFLPRFGLFCLLILSPLSAMAQAFETNARAAYVVDLGTGTVLLEKDADTPLPPASMSKLMTIYMAFEAITEGRLSISDQLLVSQHAMNYGGSSMFLRAGERIRVEDLLRGIIVLSGNDASAVIAEALSPDGTEAGFARLMTEKAQRIGMQNSTFANSNGWPAAGHRMSMRDLGVLANRLITDFPTFYPLFAETEFRFDERVPSNTQNRNPILGLGIGADGLKTGHTQEAGYGLVGSAKQGDRRIIFAITGLQSADARAQEAEKIVNWAFRQFSQAELIKTGTELALVPVWMGSQETVAVTVSYDVSLLLPVLGGDETPAELSFQTPVEAPVAKGQVLGEIVISPEGLPATHVPLVAASDIGRGGIGARLKTTFSILKTMILPGAVADEDTTADAA